MHEIVGSSPVRCPSVVAGAGIASRGFPLRAPIPIPAVVPSDRDDFVREGGDPPSRRA